MSLAPPPDFVWFPSPEGKDYRAAKLGLCFALVRSQGDRKGDRPPAGAFEKQEMKRALPARRWKRPFMVSGQEVPLTKPLEVMNYR